MDPSRLFFPFLSSYLVSPKKGIFYTFFQNASPFISSILTRAFGTHEGTSLYQKSCVRRSNGHSCLSSPDRNPRKESNVGTLKTSPTDLFFPLQIVWGNPRSSPQFIDAHTKTPSTSSSTLRRNALKNPRNPDASKSQL